MGRFQLALLLFCSIAATAVSETDTREPHKVRLTLIVHVEDRDSNATIDSMNNELGDIFEPMGMWTETRLDTDIKPGDLFERVAVIKLKGGCQLNREISGFQRGPLGMVQRVDGTILPFIDIYCGRIHDMVREDLRVDEKPERNRKFGRALARVIAHELYHVFSQTVQHTKSGLSKAAFTASDLLADRLTFDQERVYMMLHPGARGPEKAGPRSTVH